MDPWLLSPTSTDLTESSYLLNSKTLYITFRFAEIFEGLKSPISQIILFCTTVCWGILALPEKDGTWNVKE